jgi:ribosome maturation factor RimP
MSWQSVVERTVTGLGYELVEVERSGGGLVRVTIDRLAGDPRGEFIVVDDCERVTRQLQHVLEVEGLAYERLEVSSPGLDRPLRKEADFRRYAGEVVALTLKAPFRGRKRFHGRLLAPQGSVAADDGEAGAAGWRLILADPTAAAPSKVAAKRARKPAAEPVAACAEPASDAVLEFRLDEVREARLVPVVDFKGRRFPPDGTAAPDSATRNDEEAAQ